jgi:citrate lyase subunit beta / citryl-CoA lyase
MLLHRSLLFVPGGRADMLEKAGRFDSDILCLDLEESVLPEGKELARGLVQPAIAKLAVAGRSVHVRINPIESGLTRDDLIAVTQPGLGGVVLAKTQSPQDVRDVDVLLREQELARDIKPGTINLVVAIESAKALLRCEEISRASSRTVALMLGGEDYAFDMGVRRTKRGRELDHARGVVATCARAAQVVALDTPWSHIEDGEGLIADAERARDIGFSGKYAIHPSQIGPINAAFAPTEDEIVQARSVLEAWERAQEQGRGALQLDGRMVDRPIAVRARQVIEQADAIGKLQPRAST